MIILSRINFRLTLHEKKKGYIHTTIFQTDQKLKQDLLHPVKKSNVISSFLFSFQQSQFAVLFIQFPKFLSSFQILKTTLNQRRRHYGAVENCSSDLEVKSRDKTQVHFLRQSILSRASVYYHFRRRSEPDADAVDKSNVCYLLSFCRLFV